MCDVRRWQLTDHESLCKYPRQNPRSKFARNGAPKPGASSATRAQIQSRSRRIQIHFRLKLTLGFVGPRLRASVPSTKPTPAHRPRTVDTPVPTRKNKQKKRSSFRAKTNNLSHGYPKKHYRQKNIHNDNCCFSIRKNFKEKLETTSPKTNRVREA